MHTTTRLVCPQPPVKQAYRHTFPKPDASIVMSQLLFITLIILGASPGCTASTQSGVGRQPL